MGKIDWSKAPEWADRVVRSPRQRQLFWASEIERKSFKSGHQGVNNLHVRDNWEVVERRPTINTGIDWSKAPEWADRVVKTGVSTLLYWANNQQREMVKNRKLLYADDTHIRDNWEVVARRPAHFPTRPPETFMCRCVAAPVSRTIEQRIASLRALEKQVEETRAELTRDLEALGLTWMVRGEPSPKPKIFNNAKVGFPPKFISALGDEICDSCGRRFGDHTSVICFP